MHGTVFQDKPFDITLAAILAISLAGIVLRWLQAGDMLIFADEIHTLHCAITHDIPWILTHYTSNDACIPLTFYNKILLQTTGLTEWTMRLPELIAGSLAVLIIGAVSWLLFSSGVSLLVTGVMAFSPYLIYLSREARPYPIITLLFFLAVICVFSWTKGKNKNYLCASAALYMATQIDTMSPLFSDVLLENLFGAEEISFKPDKPFRRIYEDRLVAVYELN